MDKNLTITIIIIIIIIMMTCKLEIPNTFFKV